MRILSRLGLPLLIAAFLAPAAIATETTHLSGTVGATGSVSETVSIKRVRDRRFRVYRFLFSRIPLTCEDGTQTTYRLRDRILTPLAGPPRVSFASGGAVVTIGGPGPQPSFSWSNEGFARGRLGARGTLRVRGRNVVVGETTHSDCRSGPLTWETKPTN